MIFQFKRFVSLLLLTLVLISVFSVPAYAVDEAVAVDSVIYYTDGYTPGMYANVDRSMYADVDRSVSLLASNVASYGSYSSYGYVPSGFDDPSSGGIRQWTFADYTPVVTDGASSISATTIIPATFFLSGSSLTVNIPSTQDAYFDFQSSNILFDQSSASADTFYLNGTLVFKLSNLWSFVSRSSDYDDVSFYRASDPLAVQLLINGKPYGDIVDVTSYSSPFTGVNVGSPANASVTFDNLKVYYQGDTPELIGFRVYTGSAYGQSSHTYGDYQTLTLQNLISFQWSEQPDITFVEESTGSDYTGDLSGIQSVLNAINTGIGNIASRLNLPGNWYVLDANGNRVLTTSAISLTELVRRGFLGLRSILVNNNGVSWLSVLDTNLSGVGSTLNTALGTVNTSVNDAKTVLDTTAKDVGSTLNTALGTVNTSVQAVNTSLDNIFRVAAGNNYVGANGGVTSSTSKIFITQMLRNGLLGLRSLMVDGSGNSYLSKLYDSVAAEGITGYEVLNSVGQVTEATADPFSIFRLVRVGFLGLSSLMRLESGTMYLTASGTQNTISDGTTQGIDTTLSRGFLGLRSLLAGSETDNVYSGSLTDNTNPHLQTRVSMTGIGPMLNTYLDSMQDGIGKLSYIFASPEDLELKDRADSGTSAFTQDFGGGASVSDIGDAAELTTSFSQLMKVDGYDFGNALQEISDSERYLAWFSSEAWSALDSTGAAVAADLDYLSDYYDNLRMVEENRHWGG